MHSQPRLPKRWLWEPFSVTVDYFTADGTATGGVDYMATNGTVIFPPFQTSQTIAVQVVGDALAETNENFFVNLTNATAAAIVRGTAKGAIQNDPGDTAFGDSVDCR